MKLRTITAEEMDALRRAGQCRRRESDGAELVRVRAVRPCLDNGVLHAPGSASAEFEMELSLAVAHVDAGQVEIVPAAAPKPAAGRTPDKPE